jgi:hypothetical protein
MGLLKLITTSIALILFFNSCKIIPKCSVYNDSSYLKNDSIYKIVQTQKYQGIVYESKFYYKKGTVQDINNTIQPWNPDCKDILSFENNLNLDSSKFPYPLQNYKRQYFGFYDSSKKRKFLFCRLIHYDDSSKFEYSDLIHGLIYVYDSDGKFATAIYNIDKDELISLTW